MDKRRRFRLSGAGTAPGDREASAGAARRFRDISDGSRDAAPARVRAGGAVIDLAGDRVTAPDGAVTELRRQSADVLRLLVARAGHTIPKAEILDAVWGEIAVTEDSLVQCVTEIRRALGGARDRLHTAHRSGYRLDLDAPLARRQSLLRRLTAGCLVVAILVATGLWLLRDRFAPTGAEGPVVAVLPFENLSGGERWDRLARGVTEEVIADLAQNDWIFILADATTRPHAGASPAAVRAALGVDYVVTGSLVEEGERLRVAAALADAETGRQVWSRRWDGTPDDLLVLQADASEGLAGELAGRYSGVLARADLARIHGGGNRQSRRLRAVPSRGRGEARVHGTRPGRRRALPASGSGTRPGLCPGLVPSFNRAGAARAIRHDSQRDGQTPAHPCRLRRQGGGSRPR